MSRARGRPRRPRRSTSSRPRDLRRLADAYQAEIVIPHCPACSRPCCRLDTLVLELDWRRLRALWAIGCQRSTFDAALARGEGPAEIRAQGGFYYAYGRVCPAYDENGRTCRVYAATAKPSGCEDFPVYEEDGALVADLRCEAVDVHDLQQRVWAAAGSAARLRVSRNPEFPFLVRIESLGGGG